MVCSKLTYASLVLTILFLALVQTSICQNYHFSNGWYPGKKRSSNAGSLSSDNSNIIGSRRSSSNYGLFEESCSMRPDTVLLINRIMQEEVARMQRTCIPDTPSGFSEILENAANKMESDGKW